MAVTVVGVRHHSPACARLVAHLIDRLRPAHVLVEGPETLNARLDELFLPHQLPIALYAYVAADPTPEHPAAVRRATFYPLAEHSPEWVALTAARAAGAQPRFIDLPADDAAFDALTNGYADRHLRASARLHTLADRLGFDGPDALWDHLFEHQPDPDTLAPRLRDYFRALRADEPGSPDDVRRERFMAQHVAWAAAQSPGARVLVVCGGYHAPAIERAWPTLPPAPPVCAPRPGRRHHGLFLVPFSFPRLDAFSGYAAGMPSPGFCAEVFAHGPAAGSERMLAQALTELRQQGLRVSAADAIAAATHAGALARLRGHTSPGRLDLLDGLAAALVKDALTAPLPWTRPAGPQARPGPQAPRHPVVRALLAAFAGHRNGRLAAGTPRPPLVDDVYAELARVGVPRAASALEVPVYGSPRGQDQSAVLHRLRVLKIPGIRLTAVPSLQRKETQLCETWEIARGLAFDPALIEAASCGPTLAQAALARLEGEAHTAPPARLAELLYDAALAGLGGLSAELLDALVQGLGREPDLGALGAALARLLRIAEDGRFRAEPGAGSGAGIDPAILRETLRAALERGRWLLATIDGPDAPAHPGHVDAAVALRDAARWLRQAGDDTAPASLATVAAWRLHDPVAPPYLRGAATGLLAALAPDLAGVPETAPLSDDALVRAFRGMRDPIRCGDFLLGLFALARAELGHNDALLTAILSAVEDMPEPAFLRALPALRRAFAYFPPRERVPIAARVLHRYGGAQAQVLGRIDVDVAVLGRARELRARERARRFGLGARR